MTVEDVISDIEEREAWLCSSDRHVPESEASTSALSGRGCESSGNARPTRNAGGSSPDTGLEFPAIPICAPSLYVINQRREIREMRVSPALSSQEGGMTQAPFVLISSAEDSPARTSPTQDAEQVSPASDLPSSSTSPESPQLFSAMGAGSSLRTYPDSFPQTVDEISPSYSRRWASSGFTTSPGECWIADTSECPSVDGASSSLPDVLVAEVPPRFFLSPKAAAGIIRRAAKRGRELPRPLATALAELASQHRDDDKRTTSASSGSGQTRLPLDMLLEPSPDETGRDRPPIATTDNSSQHPSPPRATTQAKTGPGARPSSPIPAEAEGATEQPRQRTSLRRLTPTERERLQGFPDGWTIPYGPSLAPSIQSPTDLEWAKWVTQSPSPSPSGSANG